MQFIGTSLFSSYSSTGLNNMCFSSSSHPADYHINAVFLSLFNVAFPVSDSHTVHPSVTEARLRVSLHLEFLSSKEGLLF